MGVRAGVRMAVSGIVLAMLLAATTASAVEVSLPDDALIPQVNPVPQTTVVPVSIASTTGIQGIAVSFTYNSTIATATLVQGTTLTSGCLITPNLTTPGVVTITAACAGGLPAGQSGAIFNVTFQAVANGVTALDFAAAIGVPDGCQLNEGTPSCEPNDGQLTVGQAEPTATVTNTPPATATATNTAVPATATATGTATDTPTIGPSPTASNTSTPSATATATLTPTVTNTPQNTTTPTETATVTATPTVTATRTITNTREATNTRAAIPVVPSPATPAGLGMIFALGAGLVWALRRVAR